MRKLVAASAAAAVSLAGLTVATTAGGLSAAASVAAPGAGSIAWEACSSEALVGAGADCGFVAVPLDYDKPAGKQIQIRVSRVKATEEPRQGVMLVNPGGPGGSGLDFPAFLPQEIPNGVGGQYDWIGFDPRGVGASVPAISCIETYFTGPRPAYKPASEVERAANELAWIERTKSYAEACKKNGALLENMKTIDTIRDMDEIRKALGEEQINYYGFSYGTFLGQTYATRYPDRVRRMVLDGNVPPSYPGYGDGGKAQTVSLSNVLNLFFDWVADHNDVYGLGGTGDEVRQTYFKELEALTAEPVDEIGPSEMSDVFLIAAYAESLWTIVADAFADFVSGDPARIKFIYSIVGSPTDDNSYAAFNATLCTDGPFPKSYAKVRKDGFGLAEIAPNAVWGSFWFSQPCTFWPAKAGEPLAVDGSKVEIPILLVNATLDGATPYAGALAVRQEFPTSALVAQVGATTHSGSISTDDPCAKAHVARYLADGTLPERKPGNAADATCERVPLPQPSLIDRGIPAGNADTLIIGGLPPELHPIFAPLPIALRW